MLQGLIHYYEKDLWDNVHVISKYIFFSHYIILSNYEL